MAIVAFQSCRVAFVVAWAVFGSNNTHPVPRAVTLSQMMNGLACAVVWPNNTLTTLPATGGGGGGRIAVKKGGEIEAEQFHTSTPLQGLCLLRALGISRVAKFSRGEIIRGESVPGRTPPLRCRQTVATPLLCSPLLRCQRQVVVMVSVHSSTTQWCCVRFPRVRRTQMATHSVAREGEWGRGPQHTGGAKDKLLLKEKNKPQGLWGVRG